MARCKVRGFTFIELLIVFSVISVLTVLLAPSVHKMKERGRQAACIGNQRQLAMAVLLYANEAQNILPTSLASFMGSGYLPQKPLPTEHFSFTSTVYAQYNIAEFYNNDFQLTQCPEVHGSILDAPPVYSYGLNVYVAGLQLDVIESVGTTLVLGDSFFSAISSNDEMAFRHEDTNCIAAYIDGHIELFFSAIPDTKFSPQQD